MYRNNKIALVVPCFNEAAAISDVIVNFKRVLPSIEIFVFDNGSTDDTALIAKQNGVNVITVHLRGKGNVVRRMFADVEADLYVMVDGDSTYDADSLLGMIDAVLDNKLDMAVGCRETSEDLKNAAYRKGHQWGNRLLTGSVAKIFGGSFTDMLSGYRVFTKRYVKSFPALSKGFEIETELTVHALELRMPYGEIMTPYGARPEGSISKLSTYRDGFRILSAILKLYISERPFQFFSLISVFFIAISIGLSIPIFNDYIKMGLVPRFPTAILSASVMVCGLLSFVCGLILDNVARGRIEFKRLAYLSIPGPVGD